VNRSISRRRFVGLALGGATALVPIVSLCARDRGGRLKARITIPRGQAPAGRQALGLSGNWDAFLSVPAGYTRERPIPLIVMLHGAHRTGLASFCETAAQHGIAVAVPYSRGVTWEASDITTVDGVLERTFSRIAIDSRRVAIAGFSDGGSSALSKGLSNGDLFTHLIAYSPGFYRVTVPIGYPAVFLAHGLEDRILPISSSNQIARALEQSGYAVTYRQFPGGHTMKLDLVNESLRWFKR